MRAAALLVLTILAAPAQAQKSPLARARAAYEQFRYDEVLPLLDAALARAKSAKQQVEIYAFRATVLVTLGRDLEAEQAFLEVLRLQPGYALGAGESPKLRAIFARAQASAQAEAALPPPVPIPPRAPEPKAEVIVAGPVAAAEPGSMPPPSVETGAVWETWWFWTAISAGVLGVGVGLALMFSGEEPPDTDIGPIPVGR